MFNRMLVYRKKYECLEWLFGAAKRDSRCF